MTDDDLDFVVKECPNPDWHDGHEWGPDGHYLCGGVANPADVLQDIVDEWRQLPDELRRMGTRVARLNRLRELEAPTIIVEHAAALVRAGIPELQQWLWRVDQDTRGVDMSLLDPPPDDYVDPYETDGHREWVAYGHCDAIHLTKAWCRGDATHKDDHHAVGEDQEGKRYIRWWNDTENHPRGGG